MISGGVRPPRDGCQEAMLGCPGLWNITNWGRRGLPKCGRRVSWVWCGGKISTRRRVRGCCRSCTCVQTGQAAPNYAIEAPGRAVRLCPATTLMTILWSGQSG